jgi:hypothetical protein
LASGRALDLTSTWQAIHYLLDESAESITGEAGAAFLGGVPVGEDLGDGLAGIP